MRLTHHWVGPDIMRQCVKKKKKKSLCVCAPVSVEIVSEDDQQRISKLCQSRIIVLDPSQIVKQRLGGKMHLNGSSGE